MDYYSARLLIIVLVDNGKPRKKNLYNESIVVFQAESHDHAFTRALEMGKEQERAYQNSIGKGQTVKWALIEVTEVRFIGEQIDGIKVSSKMFDLTSKTPIPFDSKFKPEQHEPQQK